MKNDNLKNASNDLPQFEAPDVWNNIEKNLKPKRRKIIIPIIVVLLIATCASYFIIDSFKIENNYTVDLTEKHEEFDGDEIVESPYIVYVENSIDYTEAGDSQITKIAENSNSITEINDDIVENRIDDFEAFEIQNKVDIIVEEEYSEDFIIEERIVYNEIGNNLVRNPSFEDFRICPSGIVGRPSRKLIPDWQVPNKGTPDYFNICSKREAGIPDNFAGRIEAHSGNGYAGMILRQNFTRDNKITGEKAVIYREYLQNELNAELEEGKTYKITFWVCNSTNSRFAVDGVGASVTTDNEWTNHKEVMELIPVVENPVGNVLMNRNYWVAIEGYYTALGGEQYITIGNFQNNFSTNYLMQDNASAFNYSYYYIDDVSVIEVEESVETYLIDCSEESPIGNDNMSQNELPVTDW